MVQIILRFKKNTKKITISKSHSAEDLGHLIRYTFGTKEKIIGATDSYGKFYDLDYLSSNMSSLGNETFSLVTTKDINEDNMSFASCDVYDQSKADELFPNETEDTELPPRIGHGFVGAIGNLGIFEELFLNEDDITIVVCYERDEPSPHLRYPYYLYRTDRDSIIVYHGLSRTCDLYIKDWTEAASRIASELANNGRKISNSWKPELFRQDPLDSESNNQELRNDDDSDSGMKESALENLRRLYEDETISQLEFYKLKAKLFESPGQFLNKYQGARPRGIRRRQSIDPEQLRSEIVQSKEEKHRYQSVVNGFRSCSRERYLSRGSKHEIPIIVRKYNNVIEKISTSYPLSIEQEQAVNLISELELKGLISEKDSGYHKSLIIQEIPQVFEIFNNYFNETYDQIQLSKKLKSLKHRGFHENRKSETPQLMMRLLVKHAQRNSFQLLRKLAVQNNMHLTKCFQNFRRANDVENFVIGIEKIASYYRAKDQVEEFADKSIRL